MKGSETNSSRVQSMEFKLTMNANNKARPPPEDGKWFLWQWGDHGQKAF
jgi:hypothetical protein